MSRITIDDSWSNVSIRESRWSTDRVEILTRRGAVRTVVASIGYSELASMVALMGAARTERRTRDHARRFGGAA